MSESGGRSPGHGGGFSSFRLQSPGPLCLDLCPDTCLDIGLDQGYSAVSTPAGPLSQDKLSLGGSFIGGKA